MEWRATRRGARCPRCLGQHGVKDHKDGLVGKAGYEINFNRYFYQYQPRRELELIEADIKDIVAMLKEVAG